MLSLENHSASILVKTNQFKEQHHRQETFIVAEFLNTKVKMIFDVLTPRRININIHVSTEMACGKIHSTARLILDDHVVSQIVSFRTKS